jgi:pimeloyl-ACP methyl ester carboxylesterase
MSRHLVPTHKICRSLLRHDQRAYGFVAPDGHYRRAACSPRAFVFITMGRAIVMTSQSDSELTTVLSCGGVAAPSAPSATSFADPLRGRGLGHRHDDGCLKTAQSAAIQEWMAGDDPAGHQLNRIHVPTLVADGAQDALNPAANAVRLARGIPCSRLLLYPDAGHAFLSQDAAAFVPAVDCFAE